jgi:hypothetical protein
MAKFCDKCGTPLPEASAFCLACGSPVVAAPQPPTPTYQAPPQQAYIPPQTPPQPYTAPPQTPPQPQWSTPQPSSAFPPGETPAQTAKSSNTLIKVVLAIVVVLGIGAVAVVGGLWYVGHKVVGKVKDAANEAGINTDDLGKESTTRIGDPCRFLSKAEVGEAIGVPITETQSSPDGCTYLAHGTMADMTSKHVAAMLGQRGMDKKTQDMAQQFAGIIGASQPKATGEDSDASGNAAVLGISFQTTSARTQMKLDSKVLGAFGEAGGSSTLTGIGDEASVAADGMLMVRKGDIMVRFTYVSCPCSTEQIKPLAKKLADEL